MQKTIKTLMLIAIAMVMSVFAQAETLSPQKGVVRIKLQSEVATQVGNREVKALNGRLTTGVRTLDAVNRRAKAVRMRRVFPYSEKFESKMAAYGLDRWYEVTFDETMNPEEVRTMYSQAAGVQKATCKVPMTLRENSTFRRVESTSVERDATMPFNDPRLSSQWHYNNTGAISGSRAGADINLFEAWKTTTGKKDVIVAIIDGGIDYTHEDLADNVLINEAELNGTPGVDDDGNGYIDDVYGWNFCTNGNDVYPHDHGTHVAGTVAAVNNNGKGVCGVAGGDGTPGSGVSLLSVQVFDSRSGSGQGDFAAAIVYAANRGASIANCSWGWALDGYYEQDVLDAIDYFVGTKTDIEGDAVNKTQRNLAGGVMFFATGNDGISGDFYPACYPPVVAVGSMTN
ncbi:MAG: S8 family peptidase, partial [Muribaculaceae bacterium]